MLSHVQLFGTHWTSLSGSSSLGFPRQEYWSGLSFPSPVDLLTQGSNPHHLCLLLWQVDSLPLGPPGKRWLFFMAIQLICNVVLVSSKQQNETVIHTHSSTLSYILSHVGHYRVLSRVPCRYSRSLVVMYFLYSSVYRTHAFSFSGFITIIYFDAQIS